MANMTIQNPGVASLFSGLSQVLGGSPDPAQLIQADLARTQRDNVASDTAINRAKLSALQRQEQAMHSLADILGDPTLATTPEGRARLMSTLSQVPDGLQYGPGFATGTSVFTNPGVFNPDELSNVTLATGVTPNYANTPSGLAQTLAGDLQKAQLKEAGDTQRKALELAVTGTTGGGTPPTVNLKAGGEFATAIDEALTGQFGDAAVDPALRDALTAHAVELFQRTRNAPAAIQQALDDFNLSAGQQPQPNPIGGALSTMPLLGPIFSLLGQGPTSMGPETVTGAQRPETMLPRTPVIPPAVAGATNTPVLPQIGMGGYAPTTQGATQGATSADGDNEVPGQLKAQPDMSVMGPSVHRNADGSEFMVGPDMKPVPIQEGLVIQNKQGAMLVRRQGQWVPFQPQ